MQGVTFLLPLATLPYLARVLGPHSFGIVVFVQSSAWITSYLFYGFDLTATRIVAQLRGHDTDRKDAMSDAVTETLSAKLVLFASLVPLTAAAGLIAGPFRENPIFLPLALAVGAAQGFTPLWFFQGMERMRTYTLIDVGGKLAAAVGMFIFVRTPADGWRVLALQAVCIGAATCTALWLLHRSVAIRRPRLAAAWIGLRRGWRMFIASGAAYLSTVGSPFVLGLLASPVQVANFGGATTLARGTVRVLIPISQAVYPRVSLLRARGAHTSAERWVWLTLALTLTTGLLVGAALAIFSTFIVELMLGPEFDEAASVLRVSALIVPIETVSAVLTIQWMLPLGLDRAITRVSLAGVPCVLLLVLALVPPLGAVGMAWAVVAAQAFVALGFLWEARRAGRYGEAKARR